MVAHACDPNTQETEPGGLTPVQGQPELVSSKLALITWQDPVSKQQKINKGEKSPRRVQFAGSGLGEDPPELETQTATGQLHLVTSGVMVSMPNSSWQEVRELSSRQQDSYRLLQTRQTWFQTQARNQTELQWD